MGIGMLLSLLVESPSNYDCAMIMALDIRDRKGLIDMTTFLLLKELLCEPPVLKVGTLGC